jgi:nucleoid-associated protein YgaU
VELAAYWQRIYDRNADVIGADPDLILPGQLLELPPTG